MHTTPFNAAPYEQSDTLSRVSLFILAPWMFYVAFSAIYLFPSGLPQIADLVLITAILPFLALKLMNFNGNIPFLYFVGGMFVGYAALINIVNYAFYSDTRFLFTVLFYTYNFLVLSFVIILFREGGEKVRQATYYALIFSIILQFFSVTFFESEGWRATGTFNNPNQLAYWGIITSVILVFLKRGRHLSALDYAMIITIGYIESQALSKAGMITYMLFWVLLLCTPQVKKELKAFFGLLLTILVIYVSFGTNALQQIMELETAGVIERLENIGQENDDSAAARGYDRLIDFPHYTILGAGEGAFWRFDSLHVKELHSGVATIIFSYGILGATFFSLILYAIFRGQPLYYLAFLGLIILFGLTHQNFRTSDFWVFLGIAYGSIFFEQRFKTKQQ